MCERFMGLVRGWMIGRGSEKLRAIKVRRLDIGGAMVGMSDTQLKEGRLCCVCGSGMLFAEDN